MSDGTKEHIEGSVDEMKGRAKEAWGDLADDDKMRAEGMVDQLKGKAEQTWGDIKEGIADFKEEIDRRSE
ncbi:MAG: CsbD family protein [Thermomicrobiales bacterium]